MHDALRWRQPASPGGPSRIDILHRRHAIRQAVRAHLDSAGYVEIDAPLLVHGTTPDPAVESFRVGDRYLVTSTEYQMKRLGIGGMEKIYSLTQNFRAGDTGRFRNPEFTMLEWGRIGARMAEIEADAEGFVTAAMARLGLGETLAYQGNTIDMRLPWERLTVLEAIARATGVAIADFELPSCRRAVEALGIEIRDDWADNRDFLLGLVMTEIQPGLGRDRPVFLRQWPLYETTSAQAGEDGKTADRSELFIAGIELADGFAALSDAEVQAYLFAQALEKRNALGMQAVDLDTRYLDAMRGPPVFGAGMAMGFDRLAMLLTGQPTIATVLALRWDEV
jgi:lysyl-tRNA synthetase class 2